MYAVHVQTTVVKNYSMYPKKKSVNSTHSGTRLHFNDGFNYNFACDDLLCVFLADFLWEDRVYFAVA